jgi:hypothetical protein
MIRPLPAIFMLLALGALAPLGACDSGEMPLALETEVYTPADAPDPFLGVGFMAISVEGDDLAASPTTVVTYSPGGTAEVAAIPFSSSSSSRRVVVEGWAASPDGEPSYLLSRGSSVRASVASAGGGAKKLSILLARINSFLSLTSAETRTVQVLSEGRIGHTTNVTRRGEIIVTGGRTIPGGSGLGSEKDSLIEPTYLASVERIDEATNTAIPSTADKDLDLERAWHTGTSLETGQVILAGGFGSYWVANPADPSSWVRTCCQALDTTEVYEPDRDSGALAMTLLKPRYGHTATLVDPASHTILFVGGDIDGVGTYELWEPVAGTVGWGELTGGEPRRFHTATSLTIDGLPEPVVLISGGESDVSALASSFVVNLNDGTVTPLPPYAKTNGSGRTRHTAAHVTSRDPQSGKIRYDWVYLIGGFSDTAHELPMSAVDVYDVSANAFRTDPIPLRVGRGGHSTVILDDGSVLTTGGIGVSGQVLGSIELIHEYYKVETQWVCCQVQSGDISAIAPDLCAAQGGVAVEDGCSSSDPQLIAKPTIDLAYSSSLCNVGEICPPVPDMPFPRFGHHAVLSDRGTAVLLGGYGGASLVDDTTPEHAITLYNPQ